MHFFGVRVGLFWLKLQGDDPNNYYSNLTTTRMEFIEDVLNYRPVNVHGGIDVNLNYHLGVVLRDFSDFTNSIYQQGLLFDVRSEYLCWRDSNNGLPYQNVCAQEDALE